MRERERTPMAQRILPFACAVYAIFGAYLLQAISAAAIIIPVEKHAPDYLPYGLLPIAIPLLMLWGGLFAWLGWACGARGWSVSAVGLSLAFTEIIFTGIESLYCRVLYLALGVVAYGIGRMAVRSAAGREEAVSKFGGAGFLTVQVGLVLAIIMFPVFTGRSPELSDVTVWGFSAAFLLSLPSAWLIGRASPALRRCLRVAHRSRLGFLLSLLPLILVIPVTMHAATICASRHLAFERRVPDAVSSYVSGTVLPFPSSVRLLREARLIDATMGQFNYYYHSGPDESGTVKSAQLSARVPLNWNRKMGLGKSAVWWYAQYSIGWEDKGKLADSASIGRLLSKVGAGRAIRTAHWRLLSDSNIPQPYWKAECSIDGAHAEMELRPYPEWADLRISSR